MLFTSNTHKILHKNHCVERLYRYNTRTLLYQSKMFYLYNICIITVIHRCLPGEKSIKAEKKKGKLVNRIFSFRLKKERALAIKES